MAECGGNRRIGPAALRSGQSVTMLNDRTTQGAQAQTSAHPFPTKRVILGAVFSGVLLPIGQQYLGDGWTILGAVVGAALGSLGSVIDWKVGGYAKRGLLHAGWPKPLSKKWAAVEGVLTVISFGLVCELIWHRMLLGLTLGLLFAPIFFGVRVVWEQCWHAAPKPTPWALLVLAGVGVIIGLIVGGVFGGLPGMWLGGFAGMMLGGALGAIVHCPKWAFWGGVIGFVFSGLPCRVALF